MRRFYYKMLQLLQVATLFEMRQYRHQRVSRKAGENSLKIILIRLFAFLEIHLRWNKKHVCLHTFKFVQRGTKELRELNKKSFDFHQAVCSKDLL